MSLIGISSVHILLMVFVTKVLCGLKSNYYIIESDTLPEVRFRPPIGNGHIATNVQSDAVYMNGLYNGREDRSSRARLPAVVSIDLASGNLLRFQRKYVLDMLNGLFVQKMHSEEIDVEITYLAHRLLTRLLVTQISISSNNDVIDDVTLNLTSYQGDQSDDFVWGRPQNITVYGEETRYMTGTVIEPELDGVAASTVHIYHTVIPPTITLSKEHPNRNFTFVAAYSMDKADAYNSYVAGLREIENGVIAETHKQGWLDVWSEGRIEVEGNPELSTNIAAATYNILCSLPSKDDPVIPFYGLGPGGLSRGGLLVQNKPGGPRNDYAGHVFWDMDTWVMPSVMMFHPNMARRLIGARTRVLDQARKNARADGFSGAKFPWEQGSTGIEVTPKWAGNMSLYEIHVTADVSYALRQYMYVTDDVTLLMEDHGFELAVEIARFWESRVTYTDGDAVEILGVMGPDEYHANVDNSVFTNYNAKLSLMLPKYLCNKYHLKVNESLMQELDHFVEIAEKLLILFDDRLNYHPQYDGFSLNATIKQSDVVLLGYPLMMNMSRDVRRNDLELYEEITNPNGPDTGTWSMHTVGWLELDDEHRASKNFMMMFRNINEPFKVFSEKPVTNESYGGCVNFITGAGGFLQSVMYGYGGLRLRPDRLDLNPHLLPNATSWSLVGVHYKNVTFDINVTKTDVFVTAKLKPAKTYVTLSYGTPETAHEIFVDSPHSFEITLASIRVEQSSFQSTTTSPSSSASPSLVSKQPFHLNMVFIVAILNFVFIYILYLCHN